MLIISTASPKIFAHSLRSPGFRRNPEFPRGRDHVTKTALLRSTPEGFLRCKSSGFQTDPRSIMSRLVRGGASSMGTEGPAIGDCGSAECIGGGDRLRERGRATSGQTEGPQGAIWRVSLSWIALTFFGERLAGASCAVRPSLSVSCVFCVFCVLVFALSVFSSPVSFGVGAYLVVVVAVSRCVICASWPQVRAIFLSVADA